MYKDYKIRAPYFEIGPKCFMWGRRMLKLAQAVDRIAEKYDLDVIVSIISSVLDIDITVEK